MQNAQWVIFSGSHPRPLPIKQNINDIHYRREGEYMDWPFLPRDKSQGYKYGTPPEFNYGLPISKKNPGTLEHWNTGTIKF